VIGPIAVIRQSNRYFISLIFTAASNYHPIPYSLVIASMSDVESVISESIDVVRSGDGSETYRPYEDDEFESSKSETSRKSIKRATFPNNLSKNKYNSTQPSKNMSLVSVKDSVEQSYGYSQNFDDEEEEEEEENYYDNDFESQSHDTSSKNAPVLSSRTTNENPSQPQSQLVLANGKFIIVSASYPEANLIRDLGIRSQKLSSIAGGASFRRNQQRSATSKNKSKEGASTKTIESIGKEATS
jgi:hypothetical protein